MSAPGTRDGLLALLVEMGDGGDSDGLAAAREAIGAGRLGAPDEALVGGEPILVWAAGRDVEMVKQLLELGANIEAGGGAGGTALHAAVASGNAEMVELLLARGASPLAVRDTRESVLRAAHGRGQEASGRANVHTVRRAARDAGEASPTRRNALATPPGERPYALNASRGKVDRGVGDLRRAVGRELDVLLLECEPGAVARELAKLAQAPRREGDVANRPVADAQRLCFLYRIAGVEWTIMPFVFAVDSVWNVSRVPELAAASADVGSLARALAGATQSRAMRVRHDELTLYSQHGGIETRSFAVDPDWTPAYGPLPTQAEAEALLPGYSGAAGTLQEAAARVQEQARRMEEMHESLTQLGVFVPPMSVQTDGYHVQLELLGVDATDVERVDVVVLQEIGDPEVDRTVKLAAAPVVVGPGGQPAMVQAPPRVAEPGPAMSAAPPMASAAPPVVKPASAAPPMANAPPPMVSGAIASAPVVNEPSAEPPAEEPAAAGAEGDESPAEPPAKSPSAAAEPPMVHAPPPRVDSTED